MKELLDCPVCGGKAKYSERRETTGHGESTGYAIIKCIDCELMMETNDYTDNYQSIVVDKWNKRKNQ